MAVESDDDRASLLADFGVTAYAGSVEFTVILDTEYIETADMSGYAPVATARTRDVIDANLQAGDVIDVDGTDYTVRIVRPDGTGITQVVLEVV